MFAITNEGASGLLVPISSSELNALSVEDLIWQFTEKLIGFISAYPRELMKEFMGVFWDAAQDNLSNGLASIDLRVMNQITQMLTILKESGRI